MPKLKKKTIRYGRTDPNYRKASLLKNVVKPQTLIIDNYRKGLDNSHYKNSMSDIHIGLLLLIFKAKYSIKTCKEMPINSICDKIVLFED